MHDSNHPDARPAPRSKIDSIDGLRGLAILLVLLYHLDVHRLGDYHPRVQSAVEAFWFGNSGVHLFLVLSGYCLTRSLLGRAASGRRIDWKSYAFARVRRIVPPYYVSIVLILSISLVRTAMGRPNTGLTELLSFPQLASHLTFLHGFSDGTLHAINPPYWSLSLEAQFYVLLPLIWIVARRWGVAVAVGAVAISSACYRAAIASSLPGSMAAPDGVFLGRLTEFALGVSIAFVEGGGARRLVWSAIASVALLCAATALASRSWEIPADFAYGAGYALLLLAVVDSARRRGPIARVFELRPLVALGGISYSIYLMHLPLMGAAALLWRRVFPATTFVLSFGQIMFILVAECLGSFLFFLAVERHFLRSAGGPAALSSLASAPPEAANENGAADSDRADNPRVSASD